MNKMCIASMKTMTAALKGQRALLGAGIRAQVVSLDRMLTKNGCAYGLSYSCENSSLAEKILNTNRIIIPQTEKSLLFGLYWIRKMERCWF